MTTRTARRCSHSTRDFCGIHIDVRGPPLQFQTVVRRAANYEWCKSQRATVVGLPVEPATTSKWTGARPNGRSVMRCPVPIDPEPENLPSAPVSNVRQISERRRESNARNAEKSTGPRSAAGKRRASLNATKHAVFARRLVVTHGPVAEKYEHYEQFRSDMWRAHKPESAAQADIVDHLVDIGWRRRRLLRWETNQFEAASAEVATDELSARVFGIRPMRSPADLEKIIRYGTMLHGEETAYLHELERVKRREAGEDVKAPSARV